MKKLVTIIFLAGMLIPVSLFSQTVMLSAEGSKQGKFKGESMRAKFADKSEITGYLQESTAPTDAATGLVIGRRTVSPIIILKQAGAASPQFFQSFSTNEVLKKVVIDFYKTDANGQEVNYYSVTLENVTVVGYKQFFGPLENEKFNPANNILFDEIRLKYQRITVEEKIAKTMAMDDVSGRN